MRTQYELRSSKLDYRSRNRIGVPRESPKKPFLAEILEKLVCIADVTHVDALGELRADRLDELARIDITAALDELPAECDR